jgi:hypothetical protein
MNMSMNPPDESSELCLKLDIQIIGATEERREAMLNTIREVLEEHVKGTVEAWNSNSKPNVKVNYLLD